MDAVISYVNCNEPVWRAEFDKYCTDFESKKFFYYDWGTLKYVLRGISLYMPYIKNVFLIVSNIEQVPDYVDQTKVKIVLHKDIIPEEYLPTFNSCTIETFMNMIPELDEEFVYFNDDMIPISPIAYSDLICDGKPCMSFEENSYPPQKSVYSIVVWSFRAACLYTASKKTYSQSIIEDPLRYKGIGVCHTHCPCVFLKSKNVDFYNSMRMFFGHTITRERRGYNISQWGFADVYYIENNYTGLRLTLSYVRTSNLNKDTCKDYISSLNGNYLCINDGGPIQDLTYEESKELIQKCLDNKLSKKSKYEI